MSDYKFGAISVCLLLAVMFLCGTGVVITSEARKAEALQEIEYEVRIEESSDGRIVIRLVPVEE